MTGIVVVGAGQAGASLVAKLRMLGYDAPITLIGAETVPPYQRPPLTKKYLTGEMAQERLFLRPENYYAEQDIALHLGRRVTAIDPIRKMVECDGMSLAYDQLALTLGARPRRLPAELGGDLGGVHVMRNLDDAQALMPEFTAGRRLLVVGGGYIGLEAAAVASLRGLSVTLVEMAPRILNRVAAGETAEMVRDLHQSHDVRILEGTGLERLEGRGGCVTGALLSNGQKVAADLVIVGIGITPETQLAEATGLAIANGIAVDWMGRSADADIWAAGDCASFPWFHCGKDRGRIRLESVQNAIDQAEVVAANMLGAETPYDPVPWFWSDQYDAKLQIAGLSTGHDRVVKRAGAAGRGASVWYFGSGQFIAVDAFNDSRAYMVGKRLLEVGKSPDPAVLSDPDADLKMLLE